MKILFLDIDGVLNTTESRIRNGLDHIDMEKVDLLKSIVFATDAKIVLSSTWRLKDRDLQLVKDALAEYGMEVYDSTPNGVELEPGTLWWDRSEEIKDWLKGKQVEKVAILDDWEDAGTGFGPSFFMTDENYGLTLTIAREVIGHLGYQHASV